MKPPGAEALPASLPKGTLARGGRLRALSSVVLQDDGYTGNWQPVEPSNAMPARANASWIHHLVIGWASVSDA